MTTCDPFINSRVSPPLSEVRILGIAGSLRPASRSYLALEHAISLARRYGCSAEIFDLRTNPLPFCNGDNSDDRPEFWALARLRKLVAGTHGLILATPEYHGGMSGVLKNTLDLLEIQHLEGKVVAAISVLGGPQNSNALNDIRQVMRWCHAFVIPQQIAIGHCRKTLASGRIGDPELAVRFDELVRSLVSTTICLSRRFLTGESYPELCRPAIDATSPEQVWPGIVLGGRLQPDECVRHEASRQSPAPDIHGGSS